MLGKERLWHRSGPDMYKYHAFFSYKRHPRTDDWHERVKEIIQYWLSQELGIPDVNIFFDKQSIDNGLLFDNAIRDALRSSATLITILSPLYFSSHHCRAELNAFTQREDHLQKPRGLLISCARFHDGANYPSPFEKMQAIDLSPYANTAKAFWESIDGAAFDKVLQSFAREIATKIRIAPNWDSAFPDPPYDPTAGKAPQPIMRPADYLGSRR
jgi:hypothetical protein